jgi:putative PEP-CTERM system TPR-repeat lipoprotein
MAILVCVAVTISACTPNKTIEEHIVSANLFVEQNKINSAIIELKNVIKKYPDNAQVRFLLGKIYLEQVDLSSAKKELEKAKDLGANSPQLLPLLAKSYYLLQDSDSLDELALLAISDEDSVIVNAYRGVIAYKKGDKIRAKKFVQMAIEVSENSVYSQLAKAWLKSDENLNESLIIINKILSNDEIFSEALLLKGHILKAQNKYSEAALAYQNYIDVNPLNDQVVFFKALTLIESKQYNEARLLVSQLLKKYKNNSALNEAMSMIYYSENKFELAALNAKKSVQYDSSRVLAGLIAGISEYRLGNVEQAYSFLKKIESKIQSNKLAREIFALIKLELGYLDDITQEYLALDKVTDFDVNLLAETSKVMFQSGDKEKAKNTLDIFSLHEVSNIDSLTKIGLMKLSLSELDGLTYIEKAVELDEDNVSSKILLALSMMGNNKTEEAEALLKKWSDKQPKVANFKVVQAEIIMRKGGVEQAKELFTSISNKFPSNIPAKFRLAQIEIKQDNKEKAVLLLKAIVTIQKDHVSALSELVKLSVFSEFNIQDFINQQWLKHKGSKLLFALVKSYVAINDHKKAIALIDGIDSESTTRAGLLIVKGDIYLKSHDLPNAQLAYKKAIELGVNDVQLFVRLALTFEMQKKYAEALKFVTKGQADFPSSNILNLLEVNYLLFMNNIKSASEKFQRLNDKTLNDSTIYYKLGGQIALANKNFEFAINNLVPLLKKSKTEKNVLMLSIAYMGNNEKNKATKILQEFLSTDDNLNVRLNLAQIFMLGDFELAYKEYTTIIKVLPESPLIHNNLAFAAANIGNLTLAKAHAENAISLDPDDGNILDTLGYVYLMEKDYSKALGYFEKANKILPKDRGIILHLYECLVQLGKNERAQELKLTLKSN